MVNLCPVACRLCRKAARRACLLPRRTAPILAYRLGDGGNCSSRSAARVSAEHHDALRPHSAQQPGRHADDCLRVQRVRSCLLLFALS